MTLLPLLAKDVRLLARHRTLLAALLLYPILLGVVLGAAFREPPERLTLAVFNGDAGGVTVDAGGGVLNSATLVAATRESADVVETSSEEEAIAMVRRGEAEAALLVPRGFVDDLTRFGSGATLRVVVDESDPVRAGVARSTVLGGLDAFVREIVQRKIEDVQELLDLTLRGGTTGGGFVNVLGIDRAREDLESALRTMDQESPEAAKVRDVITFLAFAAGFLENSELYLTTTALPLSIEQEGLSARKTPLVAVALPGALVLGVFWTGALSAALLAARERESGADRRLRAAHPARGLVGLSKGTVATLAALLPALALLAIGLGALGAVARDVALTLVVLALASLAAVALGALAAAVARGTSAAALLVVLALMPMLLLGGLFYPVAYMPPAAQLVARGLPVTVATDALRGAMLRGSGLAEVALGLVGLVAFTLLAGLVATLLARRAAR